MLRWTKGKTFEKILFKLFQKVLLISNWNREFHLLNNFKDSSIQKNHKDKFETIPKIENSKAFKNRPSSGLNKTDNGKTVENRFPRTMQRTKSSNKQTKKLTSLPEPR